MHDISATNRVITEIARERARQVEVKGYSAAHDDEHDDHALPRAAACYAVSDFTPQPLPLWPDGWTFSPSTHRKNLVTAAALLVAEIERLDRAAGPASPLRECPFCDQPLEVGIDRAWCPTPGCWMHERKIAISLDVPAQVAQWNARPGSPAANVEREKPANYTFSLYVTVNNPHKVWAAAVQRFNDDNAGTFEDFVETYGTACAPRVAECLRLILDPGTPPDGTEILDSAVSNGIGIA